MTRRFPNLERLAAQLLLTIEPLVDETREPTEYRPDGEVYHVGTDDDIPPDLQVILPYVRVTSRPSGGRDFITDAAFLDIEVFDSLEHGDAEALAELIADQKRSPIRRRAMAPGYGCFDTVRTSARPVQLRWADTTVSRYLLQLQVSARRAGG